MPVNLQEKFPFNPQYGKALYLPKNTVARVNFFVFFRVPKPDLPQIPKIVPIGGAECYVGSKRTTTDGFGRAAIDVSLGTYDVKVTFNKYSRDWRDEQINTKNKKYLVAFHVAPPSGKGELYIKAQVVTTERGRTEIRDIIADYKVTPGDHVGKTPAVLSLNPDAYIVECYWSEGGLKGSKTVPVKDREMAVAQFSWTIFYPLP